LPFAPTLSLLTVDSCQRLAQNAIFFALALFEKGLSLTDLAAHLVSVTKEKTVAVLISKCNRVKTDFS